MSKQRLVVNSVFCIGASLAEEEKKKTCESLLIQCVLGFVVFVDSLPWWSLKIVLIVTYPTDHNSFMDNGL